MSQILNALRKIQQSRRYEPAPTPQAVESPFVTDTPSNNNLIFILAAAAAVSILISISAYIILLNVESGQAKVLGLENTIKIQDKRISDFIVTVNKNQKFTETQINDISARLKNETSNVNAQLNQLSSSSNDQYDSLKAAIADNKQGIDIVNNYARELNQKIETVAANDQAKAITSPSTAN